MWPFKRNAPAQPALLPQPRPHHYVLAHIAFRKFCEADPLAFFGVMASPKRKVLLDDLWRQVREACDGEGPAAFDIGDVAIETVKINAFPTVLIRMPPPAGITEAYFVAIVLQVDPSAGPLPDRPSFAYFTLERGMNCEDDSDRTVLCAWDGDRHSNYGDGPPATGKDFLDAVSRML